MTETQLKCGGEPGVGLKCVSWKNLVVANQVLLVKTLFLADSYEILLTDVAAGKTWYEHAASAGIQRRIRELNSTIEISVDKMLQHISDKFGFGTSNTTTFSQTACGMDSISPPKAVLRSTFCVAELPLVWQFNMTSVDEKILSDHLTMPLMLMTCELIRQQKLLYALLKAKDRELADLRAQSVQSTRKNLETKPFDETTFLKDSESTQNHGAELIGGKSTSTFNTDGQQLYTSVMNALENESRTAQLHSAAAACPALPSGEQGTDVRTKPSSSSLETPQKHPVKISQGPESQESELQRRQELEKRIAEKEEEKGTKRKKKALKL